MKQKPDVSCVRRPRAGWVKKHNSMKLTADGSNPWLEDSDPEVWFGGGGRPGGSQAAERKGRKAASVSFSGGGRRREKCLCEMVQRGAHNAFETGPVRQPGLSPASDPRGAPEDPWATGCCGQDGSDPGWDKSDRPCEPPCCWQAS